jgi:uncharacterized protein (DUF362 family)
VAAARCADYEFDTVRAALREVLAPLGGMAAFVKPGERIALKPKSYTYVAFDELPDENWAIAGQLLDEE